MYAGKGGRYVARSRTRRPLFPCIIRRGSSEIQHKGQVLEVKGCEPHVIRESLCLFPRKGVAGVIDGLNRLLYQLFDFRLLSVLSCPRHLRSSTRKVIRFDLGFPRVDERFKLYLKDCVFIVLIRVSSMNDKSLGSAIFAFGLIGSVLYVYWLFAPANPDWLFVCPWISPPARWALVLPVLLVVVGILFIAMWIGWTMAVTPPPVIEGIDAPDEEAA
jgi:hypothetical protein